MGKRSDKSGDRHKPGKMVRIPKRLADQVEKLAEQNVTDFSEEVRAAVREYLKAKGLWPPQGNRNAEE